MSCGIAGLGTQVSSPAGAFPLCLRGGPWGRGLFQVLSHSVSACDVPTSPRGSVPHLIQMGLPSGGHTSRAPAETGWVPVITLSFSSCWQNLHCTQRGLFRAPSCNKNGLWNQTAWAQHSARPLRAHGTWVSYLTPLCLSFLISEMEIITTPLS